MKRNARIGWVLILVLAAAMSLPAGAQYGGGTGTPDDPYLIYTAEHMVAFAAERKHQNKHFRLMADIDLGAYAGTAYPSLGINWGQEFSGVFDGNGKTISNFTYTCADVNCVGLFGEVGRNGVVFDLGLIDPNIVAVGSHYVGALAGTCSGTVSNCYVENASISGANHVGGLLGSVGETTITNCHATGKITGILNVGGLAGYSWGMVTCCSASVDVTGEEDVGGLMGLNQTRVAGCFSTGTVRGVTLVGGLVASGGRSVSNCYSTCKVEGYEKVGGLVAVGAWAGVIMNSYCTGKVTGTTLTGGLIGLDEGPRVDMPSTVVGCFWDTQTSGKDASDGGIGLLTAQMKTLTTFVDAGWDFVGEAANGVYDLWQMPGGGCPRLSWEDVSIDEPNESPFGPPWMDDFEDGFAEPLWSLWETADGMASLFEIDGTLRVWTGGSFECPAALYLSKDWLLDTTEDFSLKVDYYLAVDGPGEGWVSIGLTPDPLDPLGQFVDVAAAYVEGELLHRVRRNDTNMHRTWWDDRPSETGTLYLSYDAEKDELYQSATGFGPDEAWNTVSGLIAGQWQNAPLHITIGGGSFGGLRLDEEEEAWLDNFSVDSGMTIYDDSE